jgi:TonB family protein
VLFKSEEGGFEVRMPGKPSEKDIPLPALNQNIVIHSFLTGGNAEYGVMYADYPWPIEGTERVAPFFIGVLDNGVKRIDGKLLEYKEQEYRGHPGRVYRVEFGGGYNIRTVAFVVKNRLYMVTASLYGTNAPSQEVARLYERLADLFLNSFRLTSVGGTSSAGNVDVEPDTSNVAASTSQTEGEVDRLLKSLREKGDPVYGVCAEGTKCQPSPDVSGTLPADKAMNIHVINKPQPEYPPIAKAARAQGTVVVQAVVDEEGKVIAAQAISGNPLLQAAAVKASRDARFSPILIEGKPVKVVGTISYNFALK